MPDILHILPNAPEKRIGHQSIYYTLVSSFELLSNPSPHVYSQLFFNLSP